MVAMMSLSLTQALQDARTVFGAEVERAERVLAQSLAARQAVGKGLDDSVLTMHGFPIEMAFSSADPSLRYTVDPGLIDPQAQDRLWAALGAPPCPSDFLQTVRRLQDGRPLRFGAFIGVRHRPDRDRFKLYCEIPEAAATEAETAVANILGRPRAVPNRRQRVEMIACDPSSGRIETYSRIENLEPHDLSALLWRVDLTARQRDLMQMLAASYPYPLQRALPGSVFGFSYALEPGAPSAFTFYGYARTFFGGDVRIRAGLQKLCREQGWSLPFYDVLSAPLTADDPVTTAHTMFGVVMVGAAPAQIAFGLSPPQVPS